MAFRDRVRFAGLPLAVIALLLLVSPGAEAQTGDFIFRTDPQFLGARGSALGRALVSDARDMEGFYANPSSLRLIAFPGLALDHRHDWDQGVFFEGLAVRLFNTDVHSFGIGARVIHAGKIDKTKPLVFTHYAADLGYAIEAFSDFSIGITGGIRQGTADNGSMSGYSISFGLLYSPTPAVSYGIVVRDLGTSLEYSFEEATRTTTVGKDELHPAVVEMGSTLRFPTKGRAPFLQLSMAVEKDYIVNEFRYKGGIELSFWRYFSARIGYVNGAVVETTAGLGVKIGSFLFDYAIMPRNVDTRYDEFSVKAVF